MGPACCCPTPLSRSLAFFCSFGFEQPPRPDKGRRAGLEGRVHVLFPPPCNWIRKEGWKRAVPARGLAGQVVVLTSALLSSASPAPTEHGTGGPPASSVLFACVSLGFTCIQQQATRAGAGTRERGATIFRSVGGAKARTFLFSGYRMRRGLPHMMVMGMHSQQPPTSDVDLGIWNTTKGRGAPAAAANGAYDAVRLNTRILAKPVCWHGPTAHQDECCCTSVSMRLPSLWGSTLGCFGGRWTAAAAGRATHTWLASGRSQQRSIRGGLGNAGGGTCGSVTL